MPKVIVSLLFVFTLGLTLVTQTTLAQESSQDSLSTEADSTTTNTGSTATNKNEFTNASGTRPEGNQPALLRDQLENRVDAIKQRQDERQEAIEQRQENRDELQEQRRVLLEERQTALQSIRQQRIQNLAANISNRMEAAIARLFQIIERFEQRITKLKEVGIDTTAAESKLREATQSLAEARSKLSNIDTLVYNATTSAKPLSDWQNLKEVYRQSGALIRQSHQALRETIALLKIAVNTKRNEAAVELNIEAENETLE